MWSWNRDCQPNRSLFSLQSFVTADLRAPTIADIVFFPWFRKRKCGVWDCDSVELGCCRDKACLVSTNDPFFNQNNPVYRNVKIVIQLWWFGRIRLSENWGTAVTTKVQKYLNFVITYFIFVILWPDIYLAL